MKTLLLLLFVASSSFIKAEEPSPAPSISRALREGKIAHLDLKKAKFEDALEIVKKEWVRQYPTLDFPVGITSYVDENHDYRITLSLKKVPFIIALKYVGEGAHRRIVDRGDLLSFEDLDMMTETQSRYLHPASEKVLKGLGLGSGLGGNEPTADELRAAYRKLGVVLGDWNKISYSTRDKSIYISADPVQQRQIAGINVILDSGYKIVRAEESKEDSPVLKSGEFDWP